MKNASDRHSKSLLGNIATMVGGTAFGRLATVLAAPIVARLFTPEDFGMAALIITLAMVLNSVSSLSYEFAIVLPPEKAQAIALSTLSLVILTAFCLLAEGVIGLMLWLEWDLNWINTLGNWSLFIPFAVFMLGVGNILRSWGVREKRFKAMSIGTASGSTITAASRIGLGAVYGSSVAGLIAGFLVGLIAELGLIARSLAMRPAAIFNNTGVRNNLRTVAHRYRDFAIFQSPTAMLKALSDQLPVLLLGALFSPALVGFYAIANRLLVLPIGVIGRSVRTVFLQRAVETSNKGQRIGPGFSRITLGLFLVGVPVFLVLFAYGEELFSLLLGERWSMAGRIAELLSPLFCTMLVFMPMPAIFVVLERQRLLLILQAIRLAALASAFFWCGHHGFDALDTIKVFSGVGVVTSLLIASVAFRLAYDKPVIKGPRGDRSESPAEQWSD